MQYVIMILISLLTAVGVFTFLEPTTQESIVLPLKNVQEPARIDLENYGLKDLEGELITTVEQVKDSVVSVIATKDFILYEGRTAAELVQQEVGGGSGILVSQDGYILTNKHVVNDPEAKYTILFSDGQAAEADQVLLDETLDIAVIKVAKTEVGTRNAATIIDFSSPITVGQFALAIGNALGEFQNSVTFGVISGNNRKLTLDNNNLYAGLIQTDTSISEGNSGGPLFNLDGHVIAINTAVSSFGENIGFAIPLTQQFVQATIQSIKNNNEIVRPFVGVRYVDLDIAIASDLGISHTQGIYIADIVAGSPADKAGIQANDVFTHIDGIAIDDQRTFLYQLFTKVPGESIKASVIRDGIETTASIRLGK